MRRLRIEGPDEMCVSLSFNFVNEISYEQAIEICCSQGGAHTLAHRRKR